MSVMGRKNLGFLLPIAAIVFCTAIVFSPIQNNSFTNFDDNTLVTENPYIRDFSWKNLHACFTKSFVDHYHPLVMVSFAIEYRFFGLKPQPFYRDNLVLHLCNCILVFLFFYSFTGGATIALFCSLFFGIHPMHVESVAWISERKDVLYTFFFLAALITYVRYAKAGRQKIHYLTSLILFVFSLLCKTMAVTLPAILLLIDYSINRELNRKILMEKIPYFALSVLFICVIILVQFGADSVGRSRVFDILPNFLTACHGIVFYIGKLLCPHNLSALYVAKPNAEIVKSVAYWLDAAAVCGAIAVIFTRFKRDRPIIFGVLFFLISISPVLQLVPSGLAFAADRYTYVPYLGLFFIVADRGLFLSRSLAARYRILIALPILLIAGLFGIISHERCSVWKNSISLWENVLARNPSSAIVHNNLGMAYFDQGRIPEALPFFQQAVRLSPVFARAYNNIGICTSALGKHAESLAFYEKAIALMPNFATAYYNRGLAQRRLGREADAIGSFRKAIEMKSDYSAAFNDLGISCLALDSEACANAAFQKALSLDPTNMEIWNNLGSLYLRQNRIDDALRIFSSAALKNPRYADSHYNRGVCFARLGRIPEAIREWRTVIEINPSDSEAYMNIIELQGASRERDSR
jgi:tetratricopeptide (TPR) repeat protein